MAKIETVTIKVNVPASDARLLDWLVEKENLLERRVAVSWLVRRAINKYKKADRPEFYEGGEE